MSPKALSFKFEWREASSFRSKPDFFFIVHLAKFDNDDVLRSSLGGEGGEGGEVFTKGGTEEENGEERGYIIN